MELDDINRKLGGDHETHFYENTRISPATLERTGISQPAQTGKNEESCEKLREDRKINAKKTFKEDEIPKRINYFICINFALVIVLYIGISALVVVVAVPNEQDGGWSNWETWSACTDSCGGGIKSRNRSCSNPAPSILGKQCLGNSEQVSQCNKQLCPGSDGGWSLWEDWGTCTESCGGGVRTRSRSCTNPTPSMTGRPCTGDYTDVSTCNKTTCPEHIVAFTAYGTQRNASTSSILLFRKTLINLGDGYDTTTGKFICTIPGVYHFVVTLTKYFKDINSVQAYLRINDSDKLYLYSKSKQNGSDEIGAYMMTSDGTFHLNQNDVVYVYGTLDYLLSGQSSYFTGFLIIPDK